MEKLAVVEYCLSNNCWFSRYCWIVIYAVDSAIQHLNNRVQSFKLFHAIHNKTSDFES